VPPAQPLRSRLTSSWVLAAVWSTTTARPPAPRTTPIFTWPPSAEPTSGSAARTVPVPRVDGSFTLPPIDVPPIEAIDPMQGVDARTLRFTIDVPTGSGSLFAVTPDGDGTAIDGSLVDEVPMLLSGPVLVYPDLLRQAGLQGRVVLEVVIDTLGRVERGSVVVVESAHPAFVAPAQQSLLKSLFRPARVRGKAVRVRVRVPIDFVLQHVR
jgi:TonB family protein